jgi:apolipoprotein N-acyltransferase
MKQTLTLSSRFERRILDATALHAAVRKEKKKINSRTNAMGLRSTFAWLLLFLAVLLAWCSHSLLYFFPLSLFFFFPSSFSLFLSFFFFFLFLCLRAQDAVGGGVLCQLVWALPELCPYVAQSLLAQREAVGAGGAGCLPSTAAARPTP